MPESQARLEVAACGCVRYRRGGALHHRCDAHELEEHAKSRGCQACRWVDLAALAQLRPFCRAPHAPDLDANGHCGTMSTAWPVQIGGA